MLHHLTKRTYSALIAVTVVAAVAVLASPSATIDLAILGTLSLLIAYQLLGEKMLLVFLVIRPTLDAWRNLSFGSVLGASLNINAGMAVALTIWSLLTLHKHRRELSHVPYRWHLGVITIFMFVSTLYSAAPGETLIESLKFFNLISLFAIGFVFVRKRIVSIKEILTIIAVSAVIPLALALWQLVTGTGITTFEVSGRIHGTFAHPNVLAFFILSLIILHTETAYITPSKWWSSRPTWHAHAALIGLIILMLFTYTRITVIGLAVIFLTLGALRFRRLLAWGVALAVTIILLAIPTNTLLQDYANTDLREFPIVNRLTTRSDDADSVAWRIEVLQGTLPLFRTKPLLGWGYPSFETVWDETRGVDRIFDDSAEAHNDYLRIAVELGLVGLGLYLLWLARLLWSASMLAFAGKKAKRKHAYHILAWVLAFGVMSLSDNMLHHTPVMWLTFTYWGAFFGSVKQAPTAKGFLR